MVKANRHPLLALAVVVAASWSVVGAPAERGLVEAEILGKKVTIAYGRPELKGRALDSLMARLPEDRVWRAGIDEVTTFTTESDLTVAMLSGVSCGRARKPGPPRRVPAGKYTVYVSAPLDGDWALILNSDPGIELGALGKLLGFPVPDAAAHRPWPHLEGYNLNMPKKVPGIAATEVARIVMKQGTNPAPVDPFTITLKPSGVKTLTVTLAWGERNWSADLDAAGLDFVQ